MSANFAILIPSKIFQINPSFEEDLKEWLELNPEKNFELVQPSKPIKLFMKYEFKQDFELVPIKKFSERPDVHLILSPDLFKRFHVLDRGFNFMSSEYVISLIKWLQPKYPYDNIGVLRYWLDRKKRHPPIQLAQHPIHLDSLDINSLPVDEIILIKNI
jgi:hypothetical protein